MKHIYAVGWFQRKRMKNKTKTAKKIPRPWGSNSCLFLTDAWNINASSSSSSAWSSLLLSSAPMQFSAHRCCCCVRQAIWSWEDRIIVSSKFIAHQQRKQNKKARYLETSFVCYIFNANQINMIAHIVRLSVFFSTHLSLAVRSNNKISISRIYFFVFCYFCCSPPFKKSVAVAGTERL